MLFFSLFFFEEANLYKRLYFSVFHAISAFCNAGFSTYSDSLSRYSGNPGVNIVTMALIILGGIGFFVAYEIRSKIYSLFSSNRKEIKKYYFFSLHTWLVLVASGVLIVTGSVAIYSVEYFSGNSITIIESIFQSVTSRTAGFNTVDISQLTKGTSLVLIALMFIGGSPGSTAGGIKTTVFAIIISIVFIGRNNFEDVVIRNRQIPKRTVYQALMVFIFAFTVVFSAFLALSIADPEKDTLSVLFESVSAFGTVGLSRGITGDLNSFSKIIITLTMFSGRIGSLAIFSVFLLKDKMSCKYVEEKVLVG